MTQNPPRTHSQFKHSLNTSLSQPRLSSSPINKSPTNQPDYHGLILLKPGHTKLDKILSLSSLDKQQQQENRKQGSSPASNLLKGKGGLLSPEKSPKGSLPVISISKDNSPKVASYRLTTESMYEKEADPQGKLADGMKDYFIGKYDMKSSRGSIGQDLSRTGDTTQYRSTAGMTEAGKEQKYSVLKGLEEMYANDFRNGQQNKGSPKEALSNSPYGKKYEKLSKSKVMKLSKISKSIVEDEILMNRFENPYAENLPFSKPLNASVRNQRHLRVKELETKTQVLKNIKELEEIMTKELTAKNGSPRKLKPLVGGSEVLNSYRETMKGQEKRKNLEMYNTGFKVI